MIHLKNDNKALCLVCNTLIESKHVHDYVTCPCKNLSVDGGLEYLKRGCTDFSKMEEKSVFVSWDDLEDLTNESVCKKIMDICDSRTDILDPDFNVEEIVENKEGYLVTVNVDNCFNLKFKVEQDGDTYSDGYTKQVWHVSEHQD